MATSDFNSPDQLVQTSNTEPAPRFRKRDGLKFIGGILVVLFAVMMLRMSERALVFFFNAERYAKTELEMASFDPSGEASSHVYRIVGTSTEISSPEIDSRLYKVEGPGGILGVPPTPAEANGRHVWAWYDPNARRFAMSDLRLSMNSEYPALPSARHVLTVTMINAGLFVLGVWTIRTGYRPLKAAAEAQAGARRDL